MPYIPEERKKELDTGLSIITNAGELNYLITSLLLKYIVEKKINPDRPTTYQVINDVLGALEGAKLEFYRRLVIPFEDQKRFENGDVY